MSLNGYAKNKVNSKTITNMNTCRVCLIDRAKLSIFQENSIVLDKLISYCRLKAFKNDGLPEHICKICLKGLEAVVKFITQCEESDRLFRKNLFVDCVKSESQDIKQDPDSNDDSIQEGEANNDADERFLNSYSEIAKNEDKQMQMGTDEKHCVTLLGVKVRVKKTECAMSKKSECKQNKSIYYKKSTNSNTTSKLCPICGKSFTHSDTYRKHIKLHSGERFNCPECDKTFPTKPQMQQHLKTHFVMKAFPCPVCGKTFNANYIKKHMEVFHQRMKKVNCELCNKTLNTTYSYREHMKIHTGEKNYECDICKKKFTQKCGLTIHMRVHTGEKPYSCKYCENRFGSSKSLQLHERLHTGERPYVCPVCSKGFMQSSNMKSHIKNNHKDFDLKS